jgi:alkanesulfonate monooxygenase SsuD/methylene tetrahydromethanopterin reductase-like flavin-dependent oxidoreductase (luciferase family)
MQNEWSKCREDIDKFQAMSQAAGFVPKAPIILTNVSCAESRQEAEEKAFTFLGRKWQSIDDHYHFSDGHLANVKGYEAYGKTARTYAKLKDPANLKKATDFYVSIQIVGTPDDCLQKIAELHRITGMDHLVTEFSFGNLPHHESEKALRLFSDKVLPTLQRDQAFATPRAASGDAGGPRRTTHGDIFAPA